MTEVSDLRFFLDSANPDEIRRAIDLGSCDGVTTNPSLIAKEGKDYRYAVRELARLSPGPLSVEVLQSDEAGICREAKELARLAENVVVKVPFSVDGIKATRRLTAENLRVDVTLVFSAVQALIAAKAGASWVSPFVGRIDEAGSIGMDLVRDIVTIYDNYELPTLILAASMRTPNHVIEAALTGADAATMSLEIMEKLYRHPFTEAGIREFAADWEQAAEKLPIKKVIRGEKDA